MDLFMELPYKAAGNSPYGYFHPVKEMQGLMGFISHSFGVLKVPAIQPAIPQVLDYYSQNRCASINNSFINFKRNELCFTM